MQDLSWENKKCLSCHSQKLNIRTEPRFKKDFVSRRGPVLTVSNFHNYNRKVHYYEILKVIKVIEKEYFSLLLYFTLVIRWFNVKLFEHLCLFLDYNIFSHTRLLNIIVTDHLVFRWSFQIYVMIGDTQRQLIFEKYPFGRSFEIYNFRNICSNISFLPASPRIFEPLKNGIIAHF